MPLSTKYHKCEIKQLHFYKRVGHSDESRFYMPLGEWMSILYAYVLVDQTFSVVDCCLCDDLYVVRSEQRLEQRLGDVHGMNSGEPAKTTLTYRRHAHGNRGRSKRTWRRTMPEEGKTAGLARGTQQGECTREGSGELWVPGAQGG